jgi:peptidoglycan hydrolase CwlO-like protein
LHQPPNSITLPKLPAVASLLTRLLVVSATLQIRVNEGSPMARINTFATLAVATILALPLAACKDTKTLQENEQLKTQVADLQKENGQLGNDLETTTAARDELTKENEKLRVEIKTLKAKSSGKKSTRRKHRSS